MGDPPLLKIDEGSASQLQIVLCADYSRQLAPKEYRTWVSGVVLKRDSEAKLSEREVELRYAQIKAERVRQLQLEDSDQGERWASRYSESDDEDSSDHAEWREANFGSGLAKSPPHLHRMVLAEGPGFESDSELEFERESDSDFFVDSGNERDSEGELEREPESKPVSTADLQWLVSEPVSMMALLIKVQPEKPVAKPTKLYAVSDKSGRFRVLVRTTYVPHEIVVCLKKDRSVARCVTVSPIEMSGAGVISGIEDTIWDCGDHTIHNTLWAPYNECMINGVAQWYQLFCTRLGCRFHYLSDKPWQLYERMHGFLVQGKFPVSSIELVNFASDEPDSSHNRIRRILEDFPTRVFVLIGNSTGGNLSEFAEIAATYPDQVAGIYIRAVAETFSSFTDVKDEKEKVQALQAVLDAREEEDDLASDTTSMSPLSSSPRWLGLGSRRKSSGSGFYVTKEKKSEDVKSPNVMSEDAKNEDVKIQEMKSKEECLPDEKSSDAPDVKSTPLVNSALPTPTPTPDSALTKLFAQAKQLLVRPPVDTIPKLRLAAPIPKGDKVHTTETPTPTTSLPPLNTLSKSPVDSPEPVPPPRTDSGDSKWMVWMADVQLAARMVPGNIPVKFWWTPEDVMDECMQTLELRMQLMK